MEDTTTTTTDKSTFVIGSRKSKLALIQTEHVRDVLAKQFPERTFSIETMSTQGDKILDVALSKIGDKGLFTKELEVALQKNIVDIVVHSLKDLPTKMPEGLTIGAISAREDPADVLVLRPEHIKNGITSIDQLPEGSVIGTSSLRRMAQLRHNFPSKFKFEDVRGSLPTRLQKLDGTLETCSVHYDAIILAKAGLVRMGMNDRVAQEFNEDVCVHAVGQGSLGIQCREGDSVVLNMLKEALHCEDSAWRCLAERSFLRELEGGCQVPVGGCAVVNRGEDGSATLHLVGTVLSVDGVQSVSGTKEGGVAQDEDAARIGLELAQELKSRGATEILQVVFAANRTPA